MIMVCWYRLLVYPDMITCDVLLSTGSRTNLATLLQPEYTETVNHNFAIVQTVPTGVIGYGLYTWFKGSL